MNRRAVGVISGGSCVRIAEECRTALPIGIENGDGCRDEDFIPAVEKLTSESLRKSVLVLLPPRNESLRVNRRSPYLDTVSRQVTVKEIVLEDLKKALLPRRVAGPHGDWAECFHLWKCREDIEAERVRTMAGNTTASKISRK